MARPVKHKILPMTEQAIHDGVWFVRNAEVKEGTGIEWLASVAKG
jgi:hypothetical protein